MEQVKLTAEGARYRVLNSQAGDVFTVHHTTTSPVDNRMTVHVVDPRYDNNGRPQVWSLGPDDWAPLTLVCPECGGPTAPPYVGADGWLYDGWYCEQHGTHDEHGRRMM